MDGERAYYAVDVGQAAAVLQETPDRVREMLITGELEGIPPGGTAYGDWKVLLPATQNLEEPAPVDEILEGSLEEQEATRPEMELPEGATGALEEPASSSALPASDEATARAPDESPDAAAGEVDEDIRSEAGASGWTTTKQAAKVLGVSRRSVQSYVRRGLLEAKEQGEGVNKTFLISIDSLNALRDRRSREASPSAKFADASAEEERTESLYANAGEALRHAIERVEARTAEATELRIRLEITEKAESTLRAELEEERRRREAAERERDELRRRLEARPEPRESPLTPTSVPERVEPRPPAAGSRRGIVPRAWWRRMFGG